MQKNRVEDQPAFILHSHPFRETSLLLEVFSRNHGRLAMVARGARRPRSVLRGVLMNFQPLRLSWFGKGEVRTLHAAEWQGGQPQLQGTALLCGFYLNELLLNLTARDDPHESLFDYYQYTLQRLAHESDHAGTLRNFEKHLLQELGYALLLDQEAGGGRPVEPDGRYRYVIERGVLRDGPDAPEGVALAGKTLYVVQNRDNKVAVFELSRDLTNATFLRALTDPGNLDVPTTIDRFGGRLYVVNARFGTTTPADQARVRTLLGDRIRDGWMQLPTVVLKGVPS